ncbi:MAG: PAS domain-containing sensor histidine kinase [Ignavibacteria bacterium]|nr:PAS domain-containing sensor histidine kinase [Ignavibacteria bacterium]
MNSGERNIVPQVFESVIPGIAILSPSNELEYVNESLYNLCGFPGIGNTSNTPEQQLQLCHGRILTLLNNFDIKSTLICQESVLQTIDESRTNVLVYHDCRLWKQNEGTSKEFYIIEAGVYEKQFALSQWLQWIYILDSMSDSICIFSTQYRILHCNSATEKLLKIPKSEILGKHCWEIFHDDHKPLTPCPAANLRNISERDKKIIHLQDKWIEVILDPLRDMQGNFTGCLHILHDITEIKSLEEQLRKHEAELVKINNSKDQFFSIIAHDLRSPFHTLLNISEILYSEFGTMPQNETLRFISILYNEQKRVFSLVQNLLQWARIHNGSIEFAPDQHNLRETIIEEAAIFKTIAEEKQIVLLTAIKKDIDFRYDENMLSTIVRNLLSNAIKFTHPGGKVLIKVLENEIGIRIIVQDTGIGMEADDVAKLFHVGSHYSTPGTNNEKGTGLGLVLVKEFVNLHKGDIKVESQLGIGTTFTVTLPKKQ